MKNLEECEVLDFIMILFVSSFIVFVLAIMCIVGINSFEISVSPKVEVFVDKELIYKGSDACVDVLSSGYTTTVKTSRFFCMLPYKSYTSKDVVVRTVD